MRRLLVASFFALALSGAAFADDISIIFSPAVETSPPGAGAFLCQLGGGNPPCVIFSGTITDNDTDGSLLFLTGVTISAYTQYFAVDNTFSNDVPGLFEGDTLNLVGPNSYPGGSGDAPVMGLDIASDTPVGTYTADAIFAGAGGTNDPNLNGFTEDVPFTVIVYAPEPASGVMAAGLLALGFWRRRRSGLC